MKPVLFSVFGEPFHAYLTFLLIGFVLAIWLSRREGEQLGLPGDKLVDLGIIMLVLGVAGARLLAVLTDGMLMDFVHLCTDPKQVPAIDALVSTCTADAQCGYDYLCNAETNTCYPPRDCLATLKFWQGGLTYYGGFLLALPGGLYFARRWDLRPLVLADIVAPFIMVGLFFGRLGCFFNGCCYGSACIAPGAAIDSAPPWSVQFPYHASAYNDQVVDVFFSHCFSLIASTHADYFTFCGNANT